MPELRSLEQDVSLSGDAVMNAVMFGDHELCDLHPSAMMSK